MVLYVGFKINTKDIKANKYTSLILYHHKVVFYILEG